MNRSEYSANVSLSPDTLQAMRNLSALQRMQSAGWTVGRSFTQPGRGHVATQRPGVIRRILSGLFA